MGCAFSAVLDGTFKVAVRDAVPRLSPTEAPFVRRGTKPSTLLGNIEQTQKDLQQAALLFQEQKNYKDYQCAIKALTRLSK